MLPITILAYAILLILLVLIAVDRSAKFENEANTVAKLTEREFIYLCLVSAVSELREYERDYLTEVGNNEKWRKVLNAADRVDEILEALSTKNTITYSVSSWHTDETDDLTRE